MAGIKKLSCNKPAQKLGYLKIHGSTLMLRFIFSAVRSSTN